VFFRVIGKIFNKRLKNFKKTLNFFNFKNFKSNKNKKREKRFFYIYRTST